ncbi:uncharacterized protein LOC129769477 [Toxorhynchites rutilus septentrionalis]|uniref:uncharacterized protein LOC129769477 n=1 Tax=Toxorhynchites rutilus septentrionalis TaxID=329112 RepID=UPI00247ABC23|nr:uncharacterized protein LOC129769477 [Toxorhynchites rutilus septentrionalis]XP_055627749.1 uncharacterized protein LOC129769477 [Toxorhynchites rutilus septentrionalis]
MDSKTSDVLKKQRYLATQAIQRADEMRERSPLNKKSPRSGRYLQSPSVQTRSDSSYELQSDGESMLQPRRYKSINITELEEENTIHVQATPHKEPSDPPKLSFEPKEMNARSTLAQGPSDPARRKLGVEQIAHDIQEILHKSFANEIRELSQRIQGDVHNDSALHLLQSDDRPDVSLPKTADMSRLSSIRESLASGPQKGSAQTQDFWDIGGPQVDHSWMQKEMSQLEGISFHAAEEQKTRLLEDEMAWEQENAIIPEMNAKKLPTNSFMKGVKMPKNLKNHVDFSCFSGYLGQDDVEQMHATRLENSSFCSVGEYFNKMSDNVSVMMSNDESPPRRTPLPLVDLSNVGSMDEVAEKGPVKDQKGQLRKSTGTDKENSFSVSSLMRAINSVQLEDSPTGFINKLTQVRRAKSSIPPPNNTAATSQALYKTNSLKADLSPVVQSKSFIRELDEAKSRAPKASTLSDTASFTESLLESSAFVPIKASSKPADLSVPASVVSSSVCSAKKPLLNTYRVSTATKLSEPQLDLPPIPVVREPPKCQKQIQLSATPAKPNRKRRSSSATRQELQHAEESREEALTEAYMKRSRSPSNEAELKAVSNHLVPYHETPKGTIPPQRGFGQGQKSFLSPEPRSRETQMFGSRSPFNSPKSIASSFESETTANAKSPSSARLNLMNSHHRSASQWSVTNSEFSHKDGVLPLKATHNEISWGSTRLRRNEKKTMQIKNTSHKKLVIKATITGPGFQLCGTEHSGMLVLHGQECRTIRVDFCPTMIGPAVGLLSFQPPNDCYAQRVVSLYGYGGEASIRVEGIQKGPSGPYLELGKARNMGRPLERSFSLFNKGSLPAFARIGIDKKGIDKTFLASAIYVQPQKVIIPPNSYAHIKVMFRPRRQEVESILQKQVDVLSLTNLHVLWGDEPTRHRIRKAIALVKRNDLQENKLDPLKSVCEEFPNEHTFAELESFTENIYAAIHELFLTFREYELVLTVDRALDETMIDLTLCEDSGALFKTMCASSEAGSPRFPDEISPGVAAIQSTTKRESGESWSVRPTFLEFRPDERTKQFVIKSNLYSTQSFNINSNFRPLFEITPTEGPLRPGQEVMVNVNFLMGPPTQQQIILVVYIKDEKITIPVYVRNRSRADVGMY